MNWKIVDEDYLNYLRSYEGRIPRSDYNSDHYKPFFGVLFDLDADICYIAQISHPKQRHFNMKNSSDFKKVYHRGRLIGVVNLNYMFPIPKKLISDLQYKDIDKHRTFKSELEKSKYINLLKIEMQEINRMNLDVASKKIYEDKLKYPLSEVSKRCLGFSNLDQLCRTYISNNLK